MVGLVGRRCQVAVGEIRLAYEVSGSLDAPPVMLLHALGERAASWAPVTARFAECFRVFALDLRGRLSRVP